MSVQSQLLQALLILMDHSGLFLWTDVSDIFIAKIAENITGRAKQEDNTLLLSSLSILDLILNSKRYVLYLYIKFRFKFFKYFCE